MSNINLSPEQLKELFKCQASPVYFAKNFVWIMENETSTVLPFNPLPYRLKILKKLFKGKNLLGNKNRRVGWSWTICTFAAWMINFRPGVNVLMLSYKEEEAKELLVKVKFILKNLAKHDAQNFDEATSADWMKGHIETDNDMTFSIGYRNDAGEVTRTSTVRSVTTTSKAGAGRGATLIFIDEFGLIKPDDEAVWTAIKPTVARGGQWVACSTPRGVGGVFHRLVMQAERGENKFYDFMETWWHETEITQEQYEASIEGMGEAEIAQEWGMSFTQSGDPVFNSTHLAACYKPLDDYPELKDRLEIYRKTGNGYFSGVDSSIGKAHKRDNLKDYNSFISLTADGIQAFAEHNKKPISDWAGFTKEGVEFPGIVSKLHHRYPGVCYIEENGPGTTVLNRHQTPNDSYSMIVAIHTDSKTKNRIINNLIIAIESHQIIITDLFTYQCMMVYQRGDQPGTFAAPKGYNDDPVIALALAWDALVRENRYVIDLGMPNPERAIMNPEQIELQNVENAMYGPVLSNHPNISPDMMMPMPGHRVPDFANDFYLLPDQSLMNEIDLPSSKERRRNFYDDDLLTPRM
jgi:hypothetical protein